jgi:predicted helicase
MIVVSDHGHRSPFSVLVSNAIVDLHVLATNDSFQCFPFYTYDEDGNNRRENITDWALRQFQAHYGIPITKWDIFHYTYALLHHPGYRERYAENLKRELPHIPMLGTGDTFTTLVAIGQQLRHLHIEYETVEEHPALEWVENKAVPWSWQVQKMKLNREKTAVIVNQSLTITGIPPSTFGYQLGSRSALEWVIDQHQVKTDKRSGITNDPNRADDPEYLARLVGRVVTVSVETMALVERLGAEVDVG